MTPIANTPLRIGTRESELAVWQAQLVQEKLTLQGIVSQLVYIKSDGDLDLATPLYALGVQGIFTKALDIALLTKKIDIAVHSMKDVPVQLAQGIVQAAVLERANPQDILVYKDDATFLQDTTSVATIATSSIRRKAQWLHKYPHHTLENIRGNVNTRLQKVATNTWQGAIFAAAGLQRIGRTPVNSITLDWMLPAPAQGAIMVVCHQDNHFAKEVCVSLNHEPTAQCVQAERMFLQTLHGGCSTPIGALATINGDLFSFTGNVFSLNGKQKIEITKQTHFSNATTIGSTAAYELLQQEGAVSIMATMQNHAKPSC